MSAAELRVIRERLGLPTAWAADKLGVAERSVTRWETGSHQIPDGIGDEVRRWQAVADAAVADARERLAAEDHPSMVTYRTNDDYHAAHLGIDWPASFHRAITGRIAETVDNLTITYDGADE